MPVEPRKSLNWKLILPLLILLGAAVVFALLMLFKPKPEFKEDAGKAPLVSVKPLEFENRDLAVASQGVFKSRYETTLVAQVSGELIELAPEFERGGIVNQGELLAQIDPFNYQVQLEDAKAQLAAARAALVLEEAQVAVARAEWEKIHDTAPTDLSLRKPQLEQARARVSAAEAGLKQAAKNLERTRIIAPFDALVAERKVSLGTFASTGTQLGRLFDVSRGEVRLPVPGRELAFLENNGVGAEVTLSMQVGEEQASWHARIVRSEGLIDEESRMVYLVGEVEDPYGLHSERGRVLPFGAYLTAQIQGKHLEQVAVVARQLVDKGRVAVFENGKLQFRQVDILRVEGRDAIVQGELLNGDQVIVSTLQYPIEGMPLELLDSPVKLESDVLAQEKETLAESSKDTL